MPPVAASCDAADEKSVFVMRRALELAARGAGRVEPNPMVGAVVVDATGQIAGEGWHQEFGGPHAEVFALREAGERARGGTLFVTLEPCCHHGKTPPCTQAVIASGVSRVVVAMQDPFPAVAGKGIAELRSAGVDLQVGLLEQEARTLNLPFLTLVEKHRPYVHAKWAMTWDGKIASRNGSSKWISGESSRKIVHEIRGRMDAILVGAGTVRADDPLLTARPPGGRNLLRIVLDPRGTIASESQLLRTVKTSPVMVVTSTQASAAEVERIRNAGGEVLQIEELLSTDGERSLNLSALLQELGNRKLTNLLVEGGSRTLGMFFDAQLIDETHVFVSPRIIGGSEAKTAIGGLGIEQMKDAIQPQIIETRLVEGDVYLRGRLVTCQLGPGF